MHLSAALHFALPPPKCFCYRKHCHYKDALGTDRWTTPPDWSVICPWRSTNVAASWRAGGDVDGRHTFTGRGRLYIAGSIFAGITPSVTKKRSMGTSYAVSRPASGLDPGQRLVMLRTGPRAWRPSSPHIAQCTSSQGKNVWLARPHADNGHRRRLMRL